MGTASGTPSQADALTDLAGEIQPSISPSGEFAESGNRNGGSPPHRRFSAGRCQSRSHSHSKTSGPSLAPTPPSRGRTQSCPDPPSVDSYGLSVDSRGCSSSDACSAGTLFPTGSSSSAGDTQLRLVTTRRPRSGGPNKSDRPRSPAPGTPFIREGNRRSV